MAKTVGMSRPIKLEWLDKTVEFIKLGLTKEEIKNKLNQYLSFEITSPTNLRKTREILMNIWVNTPKEKERYKNLALQYYDKNEENNLVIHWCMLLLTYPVFLDVCELIGKLTDIQETFTTAWLKKKLFDIWGERTTLLHSIDKMLQTLKYLGVISNEKIGTYKPNKFEITNDSLRKLIVLLLIELKSKTYYEFSELSSISFMFPFKYLISYELLHNSDLFNFNNFGGKLVLTCE